MLIPGGEEQLHDGHRRRARAGGDDLHIFLLLSHHLQGVGQARQGDDGGAVLVVVEDGDIALLFQLPLDLKAPGGGNILQIDAAEAAGHEIHRVDKLIYIVGLHAQREGVHAAEGLEQYALALHDGHTGLGADVAQTQHGGAVGDDGAEVVAAGQLVALVDILLDLQAGLGHTGGVGQTEVLFALHGHGGNDFNLPLPLLVEAEGFLCVIHNGFSPYCFTIRGRVDPP